MREKSNRQLQSNGVTQPSETKRSPKYLRIGVDIGGTFTDFCGWRDEAGSEIVSFKVPSTPPNFGEGFRTGFEQILELLAPREDEIALVMHGTTVSTNAVIERAGPKIALFVTKGYRDILELQRIRVPNALNLFERRTVPLIERNLVIEVDERLLREGELDTPLDKKEVSRLAKKAAAAGATGFAVAFLHSYTNPEHEIVARDAIREALGEETRVSLSSEIWPRMGEYERTIAAVLNAFVKQRMDEYLGAVESYVADRLPGSHLFITRSNGGAMSASEARAFPIHTLLSGPASGVTAAEFLGRSIKEDNLLTLDMGGTSTDISLIREGRGQTSNSAEVGNFPVILPVSEIEAIGAGGGSIIAMDGSALRVGPRSAGSYPGPACFGRGGIEPALTDAYLLSGYLPEALLGGAMKLDRDASVRALTPIAEHLGVAVEAAADMAVTIATSNMVAGVLPYLARKGVDAEDLTLLVYGGGGAIHGPLVASEIGINRILVPASPSVFCALGGLVSELSEDVLASVQGRVLSAQDVTSTFADLVTQANDWLSRQIEPEKLGGVSIERWAEMRYAGQSFQIDVELPEQAVLSADFPAMLEAFHAEHLRTFSYANPTGAVEFVALRVRIRGRLAVPQMSTSTRQAAGTAHIATRDMRFNNTVYPATKVYERDALGRDGLITGPAVIQQVTATVVIPPDYSARIDAYDNIIISKD
ncbi:hydantoinase [Devosia yakushimensis]|uniref:Hydantoinase n=1 Tax=Devosia yakushimensis TaxID=470028 RepID=A0ABQ5UKC0_9HYPH|nr:hydantoinase/oxoprolinase family protein [Devosia yakushimensis]GLQ12497.1 hydantoinase [Devosia yakushimensis]